jgi:hypothetical protein
MKEKSLVVSSLLETQLVSKEKNVGLKPSNLNFCDNLCNLCHSFRICCHYGQRESDCKGTPHVQGQN